MLLESKKERDKEKQEKLAKKLSRVNVPPRTQPLRNAAAVAPAVAMMSDYDDSTDSSDLDSAGSAASYDPDHDLYTDVTDSDFTEGLIGEDRRTYQKTIRRKKKFLDKTRKTTVPILQRCEPHNRSSQKCEIVRVQQDGEGEGEGVICMLTCKVHSP